jgi:aryl-alcohol dehydrogenase-like predicted oxidoreductase
MDYGIAGGKAPNVSDAVRLLDDAVQQGVRAFDTAQAYGRSEAVLGEFLSKKTIARSRLKITSKLAPDALDNRDPDQWYTVINHHLEQTLHTLNTDYLDAYLFHNASYAMRPELLETLSALAKTGKVYQTGVSVYETEEASACIGSPHVTCMQMPFSVLDGRMKSAGVIDKCGGLTTYSRSAFLQGLIFMKEDRIPSYLAGLRGTVRAYHALCREWSLKPEELAVGYVRKQNNIDGLVFGIDTPRQISAIVKAASSNISNELEALVEEKFGSLPKELVVPSYWPKEG